MANQTPRFNHPIYGEVEICSWIAECLRAWDENTAAFELLRPEEKTKRLVVQRESRERGTEVEAEAVAARAANLLPLWVKARNLVHEIFTSRALDVHGPGLDLGPSFTMRHGVSIGQVSCSML